MPQYTYDQYRSPYVGSIQDLMGRGAQAQQEALQQIAAARAQALQQGGQAQAQAAQVRGQAWGNAVGNIGQTVAAIPEQMRQAQQQAAQNAHVKAQTDELKAQATARQKAQQDLDALDKAFQQPGGRESILNALPGHLRPAVEKQFTDADEAGAKVKKSVTEAASATTEYMGTLGAGVRAHGYDPTAAQLAISHAKDIFKDDAGTLQQLAQMEQQIRANPTPEAIKALTDPIIAQSPKQVELDRQGAAQTETGRHNLVTEGAAASTRDREAQSATETARHNAAMEAIGRMTAGREGAAQAETARHNAAMESAANPFAGSGAKPGASMTGPSGPTGDEFLKTITDPGQAAQIKALAEGRAPFPAGMSYAKLQPLIQAVSQYDPSFDAANYTARAKARTDLTSPNGAGGKTINALNTALQHAGKLSDLIEKLDNYESPLANAVANPLRKASGKTAVTNFNAVAPQLAKEIERAWRGSGGSTADIKELIDSIGQNLGRQQQREALGQFVDLVKGKLDATQQQRDNVLGPMAGASIPVLFDQNKPIMETIASRASSTDAQPMTATAPKTLTIDQVKKMATLAGVSYADAKAHAESKGYSVR